MKLCSLAVFFFALMVSIANATQESEYLAFFSKYQTLGDNFDIAIANLYSDDANIIAVRKMPDGTERTIKMVGNKYKQMIIDSMGIAKQRGDKSEFNDIKITTDNNQAKITAKRYSTIKCFNDTRYYMIVGSGSNGDLQIIEEFAESPMQSECDETPANDLTLLLQGTTKTMSKQLPIMVDSDTKLEKISSEGNVLIYNFTMVNYLSTEVDSEAFEQNMKPAVIQETCAMPSLKLVLDKGGSISYRYNGKDKKQIMTINVDKNSCK
jgi:hypothetical protein